MKQISPDHPIQSLKFFLTEPTDDETAGLFSRRILSLSSLRSWVIGPPDNFSQEEDPVCDSDVGSFRTVGGTLKLFSALPPWNEAIPLEIDRAHYEEVCFLVQELTHFSKETGCTIEFELDDTFVGSIGNGLLDRLLSVGLLGEWEKGLQRRA